MTAFVAKCVPSCPDRRIGFVFVGRVAYFGLQTIENPMREKSNFAWPFKLIWVVQSRAQKYSAFVFSEIDDY
jgi:hypothetical protein